MKATIPLFNLDFTYVLPGLPLSALPLRLTPEQRAHLRRFKGKRVTVTLTVEEVP